MNDGTENGGRCAAIGQESRGEDAIAQDQADEEAHKEAQSDGQEGWMMDLHLDLQIMYNCYAANIIFL